MTEKKELNENELNEITGGVYDNLFKINYEENSLGQYDTIHYLAREVVIVREGSVVACGTLVKSYEKSFGCGTRRTVKIALNHNYPNPTSEAYEEYYVDDHSPYRVHLVI